MNIWPTDARQSQQTGTEGKTCAGECKKFAFLRVLGVVNVVANRYAVLHQELKSYLLGTCGLKSATCRQQIDRNFYPAIEGCMKEMKYFYSSLLIGLQCWTLDLDSASVFICYRSEISF